MKIILINGENYSNLMFFIWANNLSDVESESQPIFYIKPLLLFLVPLREFLTTFLDFGGLITKHLVKEKSFMILSLAFCTYALVFTLIPYSKNCLTKENCAVF